MSHSFLRYALPPEATPVPNNDVADKAALPPFRVLTLDGGGMRGLYTASLMNNLAQRFVDQRKCKSLDIGKGFDLIVGTSSGGILACALAAGIPIPQIISFYESDGPKIFTAPVPNTSTRLRFLLWCIRHLCKAANDGTMLRRSLTSVFGSETFSSLYARRGIAVCVPSVRMLNEGACIFKTPHDREKQRDNQRSLVDICLATSAAPIYLPLATISSPIDRQTEVYADGGLWANNPILIGLIEALALCPLERSIHILSIGTCPVPEGMVIGRDDANSGLIGWAAGSKAMSASLSAQADGVGWMGTLLAKEFRKLKRNVHVVRLEESHPSQDQAQYMRLDLASKEAQNVFKSLGAFDAQRVFQHCQQPNDVNGKIISDMFYAMPLQL